MLKVSRDEEARARGDDKWMLPHLDNQLKKKKKKKKEKKEKKEKKRKKKKKTNSSSSDSEDEWVESTNNKAAEEQCEPDSKRDDWMEMGLLSTFGRGDTLSKKDKREQEKREKEAASVPGSSDRELNPYYAKSGVPTAEKKASQPVTGVNKGDGGVSWLLRAFKRAEEQAKEEKVPLEEIAKKRWGSLEKFNEMLAKAKSKGAGGGNERATTLNQDGAIRRERSRSWERKRRSKSKDRTRRSRTRSRERRRSKSRSRERKRSRERRNRSGSRERRSRDQSKEKRKERSRSHSPTRKFARPGEKIGSASMSANR